MATMIDTVTAWYLKVSNALTSEKGQGLVEYALIIAVVAIMLVAALAGLRGQINTTFAGISSNLKNGS
ncbi:MAG: Flp family type IVb pilin [Chloroflexota bacterium]